MKKTLKLLMLIGVIALGINFTEVKAETTTVDVTTAHQEAITTPETKAQIFVVEKVKPDVVICYHQAGEVMYHRKHTKLSNMLYSITKYTHIISGETQYGTFSDYLDDRNILNCTLETGPMPAPVKNSEFKKIYRTNKNVLIAVAKMYS